MKFSQNIYQIIVLSFLITLIALTSCSVVRENYGSEDIFGRTTPGIYDAEEAYIINFNVCSTELKPLKVTEIPNSTDGYFLGQLRTEFTGANGWQFTTANRNLSHSTIDVKTYDAIGTPGRVGSYIHLKYKPKKRDPNNIHWIQVITNNHSLQPPSGHGNVATYVDGPGTPASPYYDSGGAANNQHFLDIPGRIDAANDHNWEAMLFIVSVPDPNNPNQVVIHQPGFKWGWINNCTSLFEIPWWYIELEKPLTLVLDSPVALGASSRLSLNDDRTVLKLKKEADSASVTLQSMELSLQLEEELDPGRIVAYTIESGSLNFGAYQFNGQTVEAYSGEVSKGSGFIHWETGEASIKFETDILLPENEKKRLLVVGTASLNEERNSLRLNNDTKGIDIDYLKEIPVKK